MSNGGFNRCSSFRACLGPRGAATKNPSPNRSRRWVGWIRRGVLSYSPSNTSALSLGEASPPAVIRQGHGHIHGAEVLLGVGGGVKKRGHSCHNPHPHEAPAVALPRRRRPE